MTTKRKKYITQEQARKLGLKIAPGGGYFISISKLKIHPKVKRPLTRAKIRGIVKKFHEESLGVAMVLYDRESGNFYIINGNHRVAALRELKMHDYPLRCQVLTELGDKETAKIFRLINVQKQITQVEDYFNGLTEEDEECLAIAKICKDRGLRVTASGAADGAISCIVAMRKVYSGKGNRTKEDLLPRTLDVVIGAWGKVSNAVDGTMVSGVARVLGEYGDTIDTDALVKNLGKFSGGPLALMGVARGRKRHTGRHVVKCVSDLVVDRYNVRRAKGNRIGYIP